MVHVRPASVAVTYTAHDTVGALAVLSDLREIAFQGRRQFVDLGLLVARYSVVQFVEQIAG